jgi:hypothetical protein
VVGQWSSFQGEKKWEEKERKQKQNNKATNLEKSSSKCKIYK